MIDWPACRGRCAAVGIRPARDAIAGDAELGAASALRIRSALNAAERRIARAPGAASLRSTETAAPIHRTIRSPTCNDDGPDDHDARQPTHHEILLDRALRATFAPADATEFVSARAGASERENNSSSRRAASHAGPGRSIPRPVSAVTTLPSLPRCATPSGPAVPRESRSWDDARSVLELKACRDIAADRRRAGELRRLVVHHPRTGRFGGRERRLRH